MDWLQSLLMGQAGGQDLQMGAANPSPWEPIPQAPQQGPMADGSTMGGDTVGASSVQAPAVPGSQPQGNALLSALKGISPPAKPDVVKPTTPAVPATRGTIQGGTLFNLLNSLSNPRAAAPHPSTLGGALGTGRY